MRVKNNFSIVHTFDLCSTILGITNLTLIMFGINEWIVLVTSVTTLILWIEMVRLMLFYVF